jgi:hypothetical protein
MLKSELVISEDLKLLNSCLKHYSLGFLGPIFSDENIPLKEMYKERYKEERVLILKNGSDNPILPKKELIPQMLKDRELFVKIKEILTRNKEWDIDPFICHNIFKQIETINAGIETCCINLSISNEMINEYYLNSLQLIIYFSAFRSYIVTTRNLCEKFKQNDIACIIKFNHTSNTSLSITQQKMIIDFIEKILSGFFPHLLDVLTVEFDTGSPKLDCSIRLNLDAKVTLDITKLFSEFFGFIMGENKPDSFRTLKKIAGQLDKYQKTEIKQLEAIRPLLTQEEYEERYKEISVSYNKLRRNHIAVAIGNTNVIKNIEGKAPLLIEDSSDSLPEATIEDES